MRRNGRHLASMASRQLEVGTMKLPQGEEAIDWAVAVALLVLIACLIALVGSFAWLAFSGGLSTTTTVTVTP